MSAQESENVTGTVTQIIDKGNGRWQVAVLPDGSQYTKNLWTKDAGLVQQMHGLIGQRITALCGVTHWMNNEGQQRRSLWLNGYTAPGQAPVPQPVPQPVAPQPVPQQAAYVPEGERPGSETFVRRVTWLSAVSTAATLLQPMATDKEQVKLIGPTLFEVADAIYARARMVEQGSSDSVPVAASQEEEDSDDIPF